MKPASLLSIAFSFLSVLIASAQSQIGGSSVYSFLNTPMSARSASLGGTFISIKDHDLNLALQNPALLNEKMNHMVALSGVSFTGGVRGGDATYARHINKIGTLMAGIQYINYGQFLETDITGQINGTFKAADYCLQLSAARPLNKYFSLGASLKTIYSDYYLSNSIGLAMDAAIHFHDTVSQWSGTILARHAGAQIKAYTAGNKEPLPIEVVAAISKKFSKAPLRMSLTWRHLENFNITYIDPTLNTQINPETGEPETEKITLLDKAVAHVIVSTEILLSKNFHLRAAYNFQRRSEFVIEDRKGTVGISFGFGLKINRFLLNYGRSIYALAGGTNHFSVAFNLNEFGLK
ncbi:MAG: hypothetical protein RIQ89_988 [Bacteroidota bacterium]|jgi:hypothetical protein